MFTCVLFVTSIVMMAIGWHNIDYYDKLVPRKNGEINGFICVTFPFELTEREKKILRYKLYFLFIGGCGVLVSLWHILKH